jgi:iron complex outermembrane receptor protein
MIQRKSAHAKLDQMSAILPRYAGWVASVVAATVLIASAEAQPLGQITGTVTDATGGALVDVTITVRGTTTRIAQTGPEGGFDFQGLPEGEYEVQAALAGFAPARRTVGLMSGEKAVLSLTLSVLVQEQALVTASRTGERNVQTTPMAVSVLTGAELDQSDAHNVAQVAGAAPTVTFSQNSDFAQLTIRGIGSNVVFAGSDPSSAVYIDGVYVARPVSVLADFLGLERVEVLRGPQGTLYGRNAVGGALNLVTKSPTNAVEASARIVAGNLGTLRSEARLSGPLVRDKVLGSVAILRGVREGFVRDVDHPDHPLGGEDVTALLGKLQFVLNRRSDLIVSGDLTDQNPTPLTYAKVLAVKPGFQLDNPSDLHDVRASTLAEGQSFQYGGAVRLTARLASATTLTSLTAFRKLDYDVVNDADISELELTSVHLRENQRQWSEEVTITRQRPRLTWIAGLFFFDEVDRQPVALQLLGPRLENRFDPNVEANSRAVFGQASFGVTRDLSATVGLRGTRERKTISNAAQLFTLDSPVNALAGTGYAYTDAIAHTAWTPKFGVDLRARRNALVYVSATRGFKSGGFNFTSPEAGRGYAPEWAWSYEGGLKTGLAHGRARVNFAVFQTDYSDLQVQHSIRPGVIDISNAAEATIRGVEIEGTARLAPSLQAGGHLAWLDARYDRYVAVGVGGITGDVAGRRLSNAPEWSGRLWLQWDVEIRRAGLMSVRVESRSQSTVYFTAFNDDIQRQVPYGLLDVLGEFGPGNRRWSIVAYARNFTDVDYITGTFSSPVTAIGGRPGLPRQAGIQLTVRR